MIEVWRTPSLPPSSLRCTAWLRQVGMGQAGMQGLGVTFALEGRVKPCHDGWGVNPSAVATCVESDWV
jgi:hypothetical protein